VSSLREQREQMAAQAQDREARIELVTYHVTELATLALKPGDFVELTTERQRLSQRGRLAAGVRDIVGLLSDAEGTNAEQAVARASSIARHLQDLDAKIEPIARLIDESLIALREGVEAIERYEAELDA